MVEDQESGGELAADAVRISVLGPLRISAGDELIEIKGDRKLRLLSRLILGAGRPVSAESMITAIWSDDVPRTAKQSLHVHISHLRDRLRPAGAEQVIDTTAAGEYRLGLPLGQVDAHVFESLAHAGLLAYRSGNPRHARDVLRDARRLFGEPYLALADHPGAVAERQRLRALHEAGTEALCDALIELDECDVAIPILRQTVAGEPLRERPYRQLMTAYLSEGDSAAAHAVLDQATMLFEEALGIQPSEELRTLLQSFDKRQVASALRTQPTHTEFDIASSALLLVDEDADVVELEADIAARAGKQERRLAWARASAAESSPWHPLLELTTLGESRLHTSRSETARALHRRLTDALVAQFSAGFVLAIEGIEDVPATVVDYLTLELTKPGPAPFTLLAISTDVDEVASELAVTLGPPVAVSIPSSDEVAKALRAGVPHDDVERQALVALTSAMRPAPPDLIARSCEAPLADATAAIDRLISRQLLVVEPGGLLGMRRESAVVDSLDLTDEEQCRAHLRLADQMRLSEVSREYRLVAEARHRFRALPHGELEAALAAGSLAAGHLKQRGAHDAIVDLVPDMAAPLDWPVTPESLTLRNVIGWAMVRTGRIEQAHEMLEAVVAEARLLGRADLFGEAVRGLADGRSPQSSSKKVRELVAEALGYFDPEDVSDTRVQLMTDHANNFYFTDLERTEKLSADALEVGRLAGGGTLARAMTGHIQAKMRPGNAAERLELSVGAQQQARQADSTESLVLALTYEAGALMEMGELRRAGPPLRYAEALSYESRVPRFQWWVAAWQALLDFANGELDAAEVAFRQAFELWPSSLRNDAFECLAMQTCALHLFQERGPALLPLMEPMLDIHGLNVAVPLAVAQAQAGAVDEARASLKLIFGPAGLPACEDARLSYLLTLSAEAAYLAEADDYAADLLARIEPLAHTHAVLNVWGGGGFYWGSMRHPLGLALALAGDREGAVRELHLAATEQHDAGAILFAKRSQAAADSLGTS